VSDFADELIHLKNTGSWSGGGTPSKANPAYWEGGTIPWVSPKDMKTFEIVDSQDKITPEAIADSPVRLVPAGSILMVVRSGILAHTFPVAIANTDVTLNQDMKAITPREGIVPKFLAYQLISQSTEILTNCTKTGTTVSSVETKLLQSLPVWIPEESKQEAIVADLDKQLSRLDETTSTLQAIQAKLKQARASILKAAVEGKLVETEPGPTPQCDEHTQLPSGWVWSTLGAQFSIHIGATPKRNDPSLWGGEIPWVSSGEIQFNRITKTKETITQSGLDNTSTQLHPKGTVLLAMIGQGRTRGQAAILEIEACTNQNCAAIRMNDSGCNSKYVYWWLYYRYDQTRQLGGGNNQQALNKKRVSEMSISLPLPEEQNRIVEAIEHRFSILDQVEATVNASLRRCGQLRQAVLKRALEGCRSR
jgi:type I restriction enzyme S subunit